MPMPSTAPQSRTSLKVFWLGVFILVFIAVYSVGWYFAAEFLRTRIVTFFAGGNPSGIEANCEDAKIGGYPFRFRLNCDRLSIDDRDQGIAASFGAVRAAAQIYNPGQVVWEMDGPAEVRSAYGFNTTTNWSNMQSSFRAGFSGLARSSLVIEGLDTTVTSTATAQTVGVKAVSAEQHVRQAEGNLDYATLVRDVTIAINGKPVDLPPLSASLDTTFAEKGGLLDPRVARDQKLRGTRGEVRRMVVDIGEARVVTLSGPFEIGEDGLLSATLRIEIEEIDGWRGALGKAYPEMRETVDSAAQVVKALSLGRDDGSADINIRNGNITLGFIPLGKIPPL
ncbi:DUF2125 domain-containing protein [Rhizobium sp. AAP43]|uniref:DUF2125 domain-containing protein n=1 Tax=Rhizobium sp. AAP43 TaxID=1523420 RepID=UPI0006B9B3BB|nr:DUF2125 domain-containing protein [Rhizobium sp. AAP43]KPF44930.1 hypothetical protein IP76_08695 [Rhizobium sp. AAP43]